jgi:arylsulfatase A-like enzyme
MDRRSFLRLASAAGASPLFAAQRAADRPNIIFILADDLGYGDLGCYGATRVKTPNLDKLAARGLRFTDAHSSSATCTPSRYSLMTGEYAFRKKGTGVLPGDAALIVEPGRTTLPSILKQAGYATGCVGKWHLGLGAGKIDWNGDIQPGPLETGFDYSFIMPATGDRVPTVYVENRRVAGLDPKDPIRVSYAGPVGSEPTGREHPELLRMKLSAGHDQTIVNGVSRIGYMSGGQAARWKDEDMADTFAAKGVSFIERNRARPFFLYFATHDVHVPRVPHGRFRGVSQCGVRCDAVAQLDATVGKVMEALDRLAIAENTLILFSSDNGPVIDDGYADGSVENLNGHTAAGPLRGGKYSLYEGGTRVPFLARWPRRIKPGVSNALVCQIDMLHSLASLTGQKLGANAGPDSFDVFPALLGDSRSGRDELVEHARDQAIRKGEWKLIPAGAARQNAKAGPATREAELFHLGRDLAEKNNLASKEPEKVAELTALLDRIRATGRSRQ